MSENTVVDFGAIDPIKEETPEIVAEKKTPLDAFLDDLDMSIDAQDINELSLNNIPMTGIQNEEQAEFFVRRYIALKQECDNINEAADSRIKNYHNKVNNWRDKELAKREWTMGYYSNVLEAYAHSKLDGKKKKSISLCEGTIGFSKQQPVYDRNDDKIRDFLLKLDPDKQAAFLEPLPAKVKWSELKKSGKLDARGIFRYEDVAVPGVVVTQRPDKFTIK